MPAKIEPGMRTMSTLKTGEAGGTVSREALALTVTSRDAWKAKLLQK